MVNNYVSIFYQPRFGSTICLVTVMALVIALNAVGTMPRTKAPNSGSYTMPDVYLVEWQVGTWYPTGGVQFRWYPNAVWEQPVVPNDTHRAIPIYVGFAPLLDPDSIMANSYYLLQLNEQLGYPPGTCNEDGSGCPSLPSQDPHTAIILQLAAVGVSLFLIVIGGLMYLPCYRQIRVEYGWTFIVRATLFLSIAGVFAMVASAAIFTASILSLEGALTPNYAPSDSGSTSSALALIWVVAVLYSISSCCLCGDEWMFNKLRKKEIEQRIRQSRRSRGQAVLSGSHCEEQELEPCPPYTQGTSKSANTALYA